jgi:hypothetical protein
MREDGAFAGAAATRSMTHGGGERGGASSAARWSGTRETDWLGLDGHVTTSGRSNFYMRTM